MGDLSVELFVLIAGVFLFAGMCTRERDAMGRRRVREPYMFLKKRFLRFLPYSFFGFLIALAVKLILKNADGGFTAKELGNWLTDGAWDILMVKMNGMNNNAPLLNVPAWTLSAMLICEFLICACMYNNAKLYETLIMPVTVLIGMGIWRHIPNANHTEWIGFTTFGLLRIWIVYGLSWCCCQLMLRIRECRWTKTGVAVITTAEILGYVFALYVMMNQTSRNWRWVAILAMLLSVAISISGKSASVSVFQGKKWIGWAGELSMGVYLTHYPIMECFRVKYPGEQVADHVAAFAGAVMIGAVLFVIVMDRSKVLFGKLYSRAVGKMIEEETASAI